MNSTATLAPWLEASLWFCLLVLLISLVAGLVRVLRGPSLEDRIAAVMLVGSGGVAALFLLGPLLAAPALFDVALVLALLAAFAAAALSVREAEHD